MTLKRTILPAKSLLKKNRPDRFIGAGCDHELVAERDIHVGDDGAGSTERISQHSLTHVPDFDQRVVGAGEDILSSAIEAHIIGSFRVTDDPIVITEEVLETVEELGCHTLSEGSSSQQTEKDR